jgi:hypothetical protein
MTSHRPLRHNPTEPFVGREPIDGLVCLPVGLNALLTGLAASEPDDEKRMTRGT